VGLGGDLKRAFRKALAMVMTTMVIIIPQLTAAAVGSRGSPTIDEVSPGDHPADARQEECWHLGAS
jgi:hypothetical protein